MLENLSFSNFKAYFRVEDSFRLPQFTGPVLHDALGRSFWNTRFGTRETCRKCPIRSECRYQNPRAYFFKSPADHPFLKLGHDALNPRMKRDEYPQPFVFHPVPGGGYAPGDSLEFSFTLLGNAIALFPFMACVLSGIGGREMGLGPKRMPLDRIVNESFFREGDGTPVFDGATGNIVGPVEIFDFEKVLEWVEAQGSQNGKVRKAGIRFVTPFRYKSGGKLGVPLTFEILMRNLLRRLTLLSVHSPLLFAPDFQQLLALASDVDQVSSELEWKRRVRHSLGTRREMHLDGFVGPIVFAGDLDPFIPYLRMGEFLNVGKAASFGHGKYELDLEAG